MEKVEYETLSLGDFRFRPVLALGPLEGANDEGPIVRFQALEKDMLYEQRGVYAIRVGTEVVYCGKYKGTLAKRWLYTRDRYVYHFKRMAIALCIAEGLDVTVFAETERNLRQQISNPSTLIDIDVIEDSLIRQFSPPWNRGTRQASVTHFLLADPPALCFKLQTKDSTLNRHR